MKSVILIVLVMGTVALGQATQPALDKGSALFIKRGLQIHGLVSRDDPFDLKTLKAAHFTGLNWGWKSNVKAMGSAPGTMWWNRWANDEKDFLNPDEKAYVPKLFAFQLRDEQDMNNPKTVEAAKEWFAAAKKRFPNTILYTNQYGGQVTNENLAKYVEQVRPDMISFDSYPLVEPSPNWRGFFGDLQRYRKFGLGYGIPTACWIQTFHGESKYRDPSESELRTNMFGAWTFGFKMVSMFTYNAGSTDLFKGPGDRNPTDAYQWISKINQESLNLGPALVRLRCFETREYPGEHLENGKAVANPPAWDVPVWKFGEIEPYLRGIAVKNSGSVNDGKRGDVFIGYFHPIADPAHANEIYFMVLNALSDRNASSKDCTQKITLNFHFKDSGISGLQKMSRATGKVEEVPLKHVGDEARYLLETELEGGSADLYKFKTDAGFVH